MTHPNDPARPVPKYKYRPDGWPLCPWCGEDKLADLDITHHPNPTSPLKCYRCGWEGSVPPQSAAPITRRQLVLDICHALDELFRGEGNQPATIYDYGIVMKTVIDSARISLEVRRG